MSSKMYPFICPCPVMGCRNFNTYKKWKHCPGKAEYITSDGEVCCDCGFHCPLADLTFECEDHNEERGTFQGLCSILASIGVVNNISKDELSEIALKLKKHH